MNLENFLTHLFVLLAVIFLTGIAVSLIGLVYYGAFVIWSFIF